MSKEIRSLKKWHAGAAVAHAASASFIAASLAVRPLEFKWSIHLLKDTLQPRPYPAGKWVESEVRTLTRQVPLQIALPMFSALSTINHTWAAVDFNGAYTQAVKEGVNPVRWAEYSISAGLMICLIANLCGISDVRTLTQLIALNVALQYCGFLIEKSVRDGAPPARIRAVFWVSFGLHLCIWLPIGIQFGNVISIVGEREQQIPDFVYVVFASMFTLNTVFGVVLYLWATGAVQNYSTIEKAFSILSFSAKQILAFATYFGISRRPEDAVNTVN